MQANKPQIKKITTDLIWYLLGAVIPASIGLIKNPIFTRYFTTQEYGLFNIAYITFDYLGIVLFSGLISCIWRYRLKYRKQNEDFKLYSILFLLFSVAIILIILVAIIIIALNKNQALQSLYILAVLQIILATLLSTVFVFFRIDGKSVTYNVANSLRIAINFLLLACLTFWLKMRIEAMFISFIVVDSLFLIFIFARKRHVFAQISLKNIDKESLKMFVRYGFSTLIMNLANIILISSDRYILAYFKSMSEVGIYSVVYNLSALLLNNLIVIYINTVRPYLFDYLENKKSQYLKVASYFVLVFLILFLPATLIFSIHAKQIATIFLAKEFYLAFNLMPYIFTAIFFNGLIIYSEIQLKFNNQMKYLVLSFIAGAVINIGLNFIFIPFFGSKAAAVTTLVAYGILFLLVALKTKGIYTHIPVNKSLTFIGITCIYLLINIIYPSRMMLDFFIRISIFGSIFLVMLWKLYKKEIKNNPFDF